MINGFVTFSEVKKRACSSSHDAVRVFKRVFGQRRVRVSTVLDYIYSHKVSPYDRNRYAGFILLNFAGIDSFAKFIKSINTLGGTSLDQNYEMLDGLICAFLEK